jgi:hypothetical protein
MNSIGEEFENSESIHETIPAIDDSFVDCGDLFES